MSTAVSSAAQSTIPENAVPRGVRLARAIVLLIAGLAIAFSATVHEQLGFDIGISAASIGAIGLVHLVEWNSRRAHAPSALPALLGMAAVIAAVILPFSGGVIGFALVIAGWALVSGLLEFIGAAVRPGDRQDAVLLGAAGLLLALFALLARDDQVAVLGFFGGYAVIAGVFLAISAFDVRRSAEPLADADPESAARSAAEQTDATDRSARTAD